MVARVGVDDDLDDFARPGIEEHLAEPHEAPRGLAGGDRQLQVDLDHLGPGHLAGVRHRRADPKGCGSRPCTAVDGDVGQRKGRVGQTVTEREERFDALGLGPAPIAVERRSLSEYQDLLGGAS